MNTLFISEQSLQVAHFSSFMRTCKKVYGLLELRMNELKQNYLLNAQLFLNTYIPKLQLEDDEIDLNIQENYLRELLELYTVNEPEKAVEYLNKIIRELGLDDDIRKNLIFNFLKKQKVDAERIAGLISKIDDCEFTITENACLEFMLELAERDMDQLIVLIRALIKINVLDTIEEADSRVGPEEQHVPKVARKIVSFYGCKKSLEYFRGFLDSEIGRSMLCDVITKFDHSHSREIQKFMEDFEEEWIDDNPHSIELQHAIISHLIRLNTKKTMQMLNEYLKRQSSPDEGKRKFVEKYLTIDLDLALIAFDSMNQDSQEYIEIEDSVQERLESFVSELIPIDLDRALGYNQRVLDTQKRDLRYAQIVEKLLLFDQEKAIQIFEKVEDKKKNMDFILSRRRERSVLF